MIQLQNDTVCTLVEHLFLVCSLFCNTGTNKKICRPAHETLVLIAFAEILQIKAHVDLSSRARSKSWSESSFISILCAISIKDSWEA